MSCFDGVLVPSQPCLVYYYLIGSARYCISFCNGCTRQPTEPESTLSNLQLVCTKNIKLDKYLFSMFLTDNMLIKILVNFLWWRRRFSVLSIFEVHAFFLFAVHFAQHHKEMMAFLTLNKPVITRINDKISITSNSENIQNSTEMFISLALGFWFISKFKPTI